MIFSFSTRSYDLVLYTPRMSESGIRGETNSPSRTEQRNVCLLLVDSKNAMKDSHPRMFLLFNGIVSHGHTHQVGGMATAKTRHRGLYYLFTMGSARINYERSAVSTCGSRYSGMRAADLSWTPCRISGSACIS